MQVVRQVVRVASVLALTLATCGVPTTPQVVSHVQAHSTHRAGMYAYERAGEVSIHRTPVRASRGHARTALVGRVVPEIVKSSEGIQSISKGSIWDALANCETGGRWQYNGPSGYDGGLQFAPSTWRTMIKRFFHGFPPYAWMASRAQQILVGMKVRALSGWGQWPGCARRLGLL